MNEIESLIFLLGAAALLAQLARALNVPYPIFLVLGGLGIGFVPGLPDVEIPPEAPYLNATMGRGFANRSPRSAWPNRLPAEVRGGSKQRRQGEIFTAPKRTEDYALAFVEDGSAREPRYVRQPLENEPNYLVYSANHGLRKSHSP